jgi:cytidylate kinase
MSRASRTPVIAVDGPSAAGKGTLARRLASHFGYAFLDTGLLYRAVAAKVLGAGGDPSDAAAATKAAQGLRLDELDAPELRSDAVAQGASKVAAIPAVRSALLDPQRRFAAAPPGGAPGAVLDGRDIGTVVCPDATVKLFITAGPEVRAARRARENLGSRELIGPEAEGIYARVLQDMIERDARDSGRTVAPLLPARDALIIDSSALDPDAAFAAALAHISTSGLIAKA